jgi:hypothetical protein
MLYKNKHIFPDYYYYKPKHSLEKNNKKFKATQQLQAYIPVINHELIKRIITIKNDSNSSCFGVEYLLHSDIIT